MYDPTNYKHGFIVQNTLELGININALYTFFGFCVNKPIHSAFIVTDEQEFLMTEDELLPISNAYRMGKRLDFLSVLESPDIKTPAIAVTPNAASKALFSELSPQKVTFCPFSVKLIQRPIMKSVRYQEGLISSALGLPSLLAPTSFDDEAEAVLSCQDPDDKLEAILNILYWLKVVEGVTPHNDLINAAIAQEALDWYKDDSERLEQFFSTHEV